MPRPRDILQRFRPSGTPGAASTIGVPADRVAEVSAELEPVLARVRETQQEAARIRADARREAERMRQESVEEGRTLVTTARRQAQAARADAAVRAGRRLEEELRASRESAAREAEAVHRGAASRLPSYVGRVVAGVRAALDATAEPPA